MSVVYRPALDGLRGVGILTVMAYHTGLLRGGWLGVDVFFALSGFLITSLLLEERARTGAISFRKFYVRRALRLLPALLLLIVGCRLALLDSPRPAYWGLDAANVAAVLFYVANWAMLWGLGLGLFGHAWSLAIEEQFYFLWPPLVALLCRWVRRRGAVVALVAAATVAGVALRIALAHAGAGMPRLFLGLDTHGDAILVGCLAGFLSTWSLLPASPAARAALRGAGAVGAVGLTVLFFTAAFPRAYVWHGASTLAALAATLVILDAARPGSRQAAALAFPPLVAVGRISYGLYLWHFPLFIGVGVLNPAGAVAPAVWIAAAWLATFAAATVSYWLVERPALGLKARFRG